MSQSEKKKQKKRPSSAVSTSLSQRVAAKTEGAEDERFSLSKWSGTKMSISRISSPCLQVQKGACVSHSHYVAISFQLLYLWCLNLLKWKPALVSLDCPLLILLMGQSGGQLRGFQRSTMQSFTGQKRPPPPPTKILGLCQQEEDSSRNCQMNVLTNKIRPPLRPRGRERWVLLAVTSTQIRSCPSGA